MSKVTKDIKLVGILAVLRVAYSFLIRPLIKQAVDDPDETWDDALMEILDRLFAYTGPE